MEYDFKTKCRAVFANSIALYTESRIDLNASFFNTIHDFCEYLINIDANKYFNEVELIIYFKKKKNNYYAYENEKTLSDFIDLTTKINSLEKLNKLYNELDYDIVDRIGQLAVMYVEYVNNLRFRSISKIKQ